jgi:type VI secretion system secreted protein Hcp
MDVFILDCGDAIKGDCQLAGYQGKIELLSFSHGVAQQITGDQSNTKRTSGKPNHMDFTVVKYLDLATCQLIDHCNQAKPILKVRMTIGQNDNGRVTQRFVYELDNALVSSVSTAGDAKGKPQETVTFNYTRISWKCVGSNASAVWSLEKNSAT